MDRQPDACATYERRSRRTPEGNAGGHHHCEHESGGGRRDGPRGEVARPFGQQTGEKGGQCNKERRAGGEQGSRHGRLRMARSKRVLAPGLPEGTSFEKFKD